MIKSLIRMKSFGKTRLRVIIAKVAIEWNREMNKISTKIKSKGKMQITDMDNLQHLRRRMCKDRKSTILVEKGFISLILF
jgi:hypothetical protein